MGCWVNRKPPLEMAVGEQGCPLRKGRKGTFIGEFKGVKEFVNQGTEIPESTGKD